jgi:hypothetical protein
MQTHGPSCLEGPISATRPWWQDGDAPAETLKFTQPASSGGVEQAVTSLDRHAGDEEPFRADLVARVRKEIANGTYDTPDKWDKALDRLLKQLEGT